MSYQIDITRIEIVDNGDVVIEIEAIDGESAKVTMNVTTSVDDWRDLANAVSQSLMLMQLKAAT